MVKWVPIARVRDERIFRTVAPGGLSKFVTVCGCGCVFRKDRIVLLEFFLKISVGTCMGFGG